MTTGWTRPVLPTFSFAMVAALGDIYFVLGYSIVVAMITFVIRALLVRQTMDNDIYA